VFYLVSCVSFGESLCANRTYCRLSPTTPFVSFFFFFFFFIIFFFFLHFHRPSRLLLSVCSCERVLFFFFLTGFLRVLPPFDCRLHASNTHTISLSLSLSPSNVSYPIVSSRILACPRVSSSSRRQRIENEQFDHALLSPAFKHNLFSDRTSVCSETARSAQQTHKSCFRAV
jgi:hypothetical protein